MIFFKQYRLQRRANITIDFLTNVDDKTHKAYIKLIDGLRQADDNHAQAYAAKIKEFNKALGGTGRKRTGDEPKMVQDLGGFLDYEK